MRCAAEPALLPFPQPAACCLLCLCGTPRRAMRRAKHHGPLAACAWLTRCACMRAWPPAALEPAGTAAEMVYPGGEAAFVARMVEDSSGLRDSVHWCVQRGTEQLRGGLWHLKPAVSCGWGVSLKGGTPSLYHHHSCTGTARACTCPAWHRFSSMLGKKATLKAARMQLHGMRVTALRTTELAQVRAAGCGLRVALRWPAAWEDTTPCRGPAVQAA